LVCVFVMEGLAGGGAPGGREAKDDDSERAAVRGTSSAGFGARPFRAASGCAGAVVLGMASRSKEGRADPPRSGDGGWERRITIPGERGP